MAESFELYCKHKCCWLLKSSKIKKIDRYPCDRNIRRSGIVLIDKFNRILISQSYNRCWGVPKGMIEQGETSIDASIRELVEETGIRLEREILENARILELDRDDISLFFVKLDQIGPNVTDPSRLNSESTGCGWVYTNCLWNMSRTKRLKLNSVTKYVLNNMFTKYWTVLRVI